MRTSYLALPVLLLGALAAGANESPGPPPERAELVRELESALSAPGWEDDRWSVLVLSLDGGDTLYSRNAEVPRAPASNLKLFTTAAALYVLGPDYRYPTFLTATGPIRDGVIEGDLYVYGTGDPTLSARFFESRTAIWEALADSLSAAGIERIAGDLVGDASYFEGSPVGRGWRKSYVTHTYAAPATALAYNDNVVTLRVTPGAEVGARPNIQLVPGGSVDLEVEAETTRSGRSWVGVERSGYDEPVVLRGTIRQGSSALWRAVPVLDPARFAVSMFREVLAERGIRVDGRLRSRYEAEGSLITGQRVFAPASPEDPPIQVLSVHRSPPLVEILDVINQRSHNLYADMVLRTVGRVATGHGSAEGGEAVAVALLEEAGYPEAPLEMDDGSGLSSLDRASARSIVTLLAFMAESPYADEFFATLPEAATSRGLRRMHRTPAAGNLRAKTGTIDEVSALSGYVRTRSDELLAFSILSNGVPSTWTAKRVEDRIGARLAAFDRPAPRRMAGPERSGGAGEAIESGRVDSVLAARQAEAEAEAARRAEAARQTEASQERYYTIKRGDTLEGIARKLDTTVRALREANPGVQPRRLLPGESIRVPGA
jgi:D-alanyl-D-alanine carboxypeptidase/D-alanyl-D-alanine-endopeptidase (penicillin-binding protein 4)